MNGLRCVTCQKTYEDEPEIYSRLKDFEEYCICWNCVRFYRKTADPDAAISAGRHEPTGQESRR